MRERERQSGFALRQRVRGLRPFAVKAKTSAERNRVVASLRPAPLAFCGLDGLTPLIAAGLVRLHAQPVFELRITTDLSPHILPAASSMRTLTPAKQ